MQEKCLPVGGSNSLLLQGGALPKPRLSAVDVCNINGCKALE